MLNNQSLIFGNRVTPINLKTKFRVGLNLFMAWLMFLLVIIDWGSFPQYGCKFWAYFLVWSPAVQMQKDGHFS